MMIFENYLASFSPLLTRCAVQSAISSNKKILFTQAASTFTANGSVVFFVINDAICIPCCRGCLATVLLLWFILFVRGAGWSLKYKHDIWIVLFQILRSFLGRPHTDQFPDDVPVKVMAEQKSRFL
jgi:hypothetical protein